MFEMGLVSSMLIGRTGDNLGDDADNRTHNSDNNGGDGELLGGRQTPLSFGRCRLVTGFHWKIKTKNIDMEQLLESVS